MNKKACFKAMVLVLSAIMLLSFAACNKSAVNDKKDQTSEQSGGSKSNFNEKGLPITNEQVTYRIMTSQAALSKKAITEKDFYKKMENQTNVKIQWQEVPSTGWKEKINLAVNSGDLPDAMFAAGMSMGDAIESGLIVELDEYIKYAPNLQKFLNAYPVAKSATTYQKDGKMYFLPGMQPKDYAQCRAPIFLNKTWLEKLGLNVPKTTEEFYQVLKAFKTKDPNGNGKADEIPYGFAKTWIGFEFYELFGAWDIMAVKNPANTTIRDGNLDFNPINEKFRSALEYINKLYSEGLIDIESITQDESTLKAKASKEPAIYGGFINWTADLYCGPELAKQYEAILPLEGPFGDRKYSRNDTVQIQNTMTIFKGCKQPEVLVRWYDTIMEGTNSIEVFAGSEGIGWTKDEASKTWKVNTDKLKSMGLSFDEYRITEATQASVGTWAPEVSGYKYEQISGSSEDLKQEWTDMYKPYFFKEVWPSSVPIMTATEESKEIALLLTDLNTYIEAFVADAVTKGLNDQKWEQHLKDCEKLKYKKVVEYYQKQYDSFKK